MDNICCDEIKIGQSFEGYVWKSDRKEPEIIDHPAGETVMKLDSSVNPFINEAQLYDTEKKVSYGVKYVDGKYVVSRKSLADIASDETDDYGEPGSLGDSPLKFMSNRMGGRTLLFRRFWKAVDGGEMLAGMRTLEPSAMFFCGFDENKQ